MTAYVADHETGDPLCPRCSVSACISISYECRDEGCRCACRTDPDADRARELDDRPADKLAVIAGEMERENRPDDGGHDRQQLADVLTRERFALSQRRRCKSCGAPIIWASTATGAAMPVDPDPIGGGNLQLTRRGDESVTAAVVRPGEGTHRSHYASCPHADQWRSRSAA